MRFLQLNGFEGYRAFFTKPERIHREQIQIRCSPESVFTFIRCKLGFLFLFVAL